ncbi:hypothetical protein Tco_1308147 [Tanacetum coccineum]
MEEPKERPNEPEMSDNKNSKHLDVYNAAYSPRQLVKKDIAESLYQVLSFYESGIIQEIGKCKWKKQHIKNVEKDLGEVDHELPKTSVPRTDVGFFPVTKIETRSYWSTASIPDEHEKKNLMLNNFDCYHLTIVVTSSFRYLK